MREQARASQAPIDRSMRGGLLDDAIASRAVPLRPDRADHLEPGRNVFQRFRNVLAERAEFASAIRATLFGGSQYLGFPSQVRGQRAPRRAAGST